jgi:transposase
LKTPNYLSIGIWSFLTSGVIAAAFLFAIIQPLKVADDHFEAEKAKLNPEDENYEARVAMLRDSLENAQLIMGYSYKEISKTQEKLGIKAKPVYSGTYELSFEVHGCIETYLISGTFADSVRSSLRKAAAMPYKDIHGFMEHWKAKLREQNLKNLKTAFNSKVPKFAAYSDEQILEELEAILSDAFEITLEEVRYQISNFDPIDLHPLDNIQAAQKLKFELQTYKNPADLHTQLMMAPKVEFVELVEAVELFGQNGKGPIVQLNDSLKARDSTTFEERGPLFSKMSIMIDGSTTADDPFRAMISVKDTAEVMHLLNTELAKKMMGDGVQFVLENEAQLGENGDKFVSLFVLDLNAKPMLLKGDAIKHAYATSDYTGDGFAVSIEFNTKAARAWKRMTEQNVNKCIAIMVNDQLLSWPRVNEPISNGFTSISGNFTAMEAQKIAKSISNPLQNVIPVQLISAEWEKEDQNAERSWGPILTAFFIFTLTTTLVFLGIFFFISKIREGRQ